MMTSQSSSSSEVPGFEGLPGFPSVRELFGMPSEEKMGSTMDQVLGELAQLREQMDVRITQAFKAIEASHSEIMNALEALAKGRNLPQGKKRKFQCRRGPDGFISEIEEV